LSLSGYTFTLGACIVVVGAAQLFAADSIEDSIEVAGMVKPAVWDGEIWRLFTATLLHANFTHFWMNFLALVHFSKIVEQTVQRVFVPLLFLLNGAIGSVFSVLLYPGQYFGGRLWRANGAALASAPPLPIAAHFDRTRYPPKYFRQMIEAIIFFGMLSLFGFAFIDNAAHLGGLGGGLLLGWFLLRLQRPVDQSERKTA
jgi:membrane associated rhomboid family serine protease